MTTPMLGIIPAAGSGVRARPYTYEVHKGLFPIDGRTNLERTISIMRDDMGIKEVVIVVGYMADAVREAFGDGSALGVRVSYVENCHLDRGWAWSVLIARPYLADRNACIMLSDEFYLNANFKDYTASISDDAIATIAVKTTDDPELIRRNFAVERKGDQIVRLTESPSRVTNDILGMATFVITPQLFELLDKAYDRGRTSIEFVNFIDELIAGGHTVKAFDLEGEYINLNDVASLESATDLAIRDRLKAEAKT
jgi:NDP-sugar pyrophosphorylase family protein